MFEISDTLAPELYPMAWLVGSWRGYGVLGYANIDDASIIVDLEVTASDRPYLTFSYTWTLAKENPAEVNNELPGDRGVAQLTEDMVWAEATGYLRPSSENEGEIEAMVATPDGRVGIHVGYIKGPRAELVSDAMVRTATGADVTATKTQLGLVEGDMLFAVDMAAFGHEMRNYSAGRLTKVTA